MEIPSLNLSNLLLKSPTSASGLTVGRVSVVYQLRITEWLPSGWVVLVNTALAFSFPQF